MSNQNKLKFSLSWKPIPRFWIFQFGKSHYFPKVSSSERKRVLLMGSVQICPCAALFANAKNVDASEFQVNN